MNTYSHSGSLGDILSSLAVVNILGPGDYYIRLNNMDAVAQSIGWPGAGRHSGRLTQKDFDMIAPLLEQQPMINSVKVWNGEHIDYEFEKQARHHNPPGWPRSFSRQYADAMGLNLDEYHLDLDVHPFLFTDENITIPGRPICVSRNEWYLDGIQDLGPVSAWATWIEYGLEDQAFFVGHESEYEWFKQVMDINIPHIPTQNMLELSRLIGGAEMIIANQSMPGTMAVSMGKTCYIETRKNTPLENNEIYYPYHLNAHYF